VIQSSDEVDSRRRPMNKNDYLSLQANVICLLLALIGTTVIIEHPDWFGRVPGNDVPQWEFVTPQSN
jgi:hypothetical protein